MTTFPKNLSSPPRVIFSPGSHQHLLMPFDSVIIKSSPASHRPNSPRTELLYYAPLFPLRQITAPLTGSYNCSFFQIRHHHPFPRRFFFCFFFFFGSLGFLFFFWSFLSWTPLPLDPTAPPPPDAVEDTASATVFFHPYRTRLQTPSLSSCLL